MDMDERILSLVCAGGFFWGTEAFAFVFVLFAAAARVVVVVGRQDAIAMGLHTLLRACFCFTVPPENFCSMVSSSFSNSFKT